MLTVMFVFDKMGVKIANLVHFLIFRIAACTVTGPSSSRLQYRIGENATFLWNSTTTILQVRFGLYDSIGDGIFPQFVSVRSGPRVQYSNLSNTPAERYVGRVQWVGDLSLGRAWIALIKLKEEDFKVAYAANIIESGNLVGTTFPVNLTLSQDSTTSPTTTPKPSTTTTPEVTTTPTPKPKTPEWMIAVIVICVIVLVVVIVIITCYCFCPKYLQSFRICICRCCPKYCQDCCKRICRCCPKCFLDEETPPPAKEGHDMKPTSVASE